MNAASQPVHVFSRPLSWQLLWEVAAGELRLQRRSWGLWLLALFFLAIIVTQSPVFESPSFTPLEAAAIWSDRTALMGSLLALLLAPFVLDRTRRVGSASLELGKPFDDRFYALGKLLGVGLTILSILSFGGLLSLATGLPRLETSLWLQTGMAYLVFGLQIALPPVFFALAITFCLSRFLPPLWVVPLYLVYLVVSTLTPSAADARFSWLSPVVRPEYFGAALPAEILPLVRLHQSLYLALALVAVLVSALAFDRRVFLGEPSSFLLRLKKHLQLPLVLSPSFRRRLSPAALAAVLLALAIPSMSLDWNSPHAFLRQDFAFLALEFYLPLSGLLLMGGGLGLDHEAGALDLILTRPVNRWRLLAERLSPGFAAYIVLTLGLVAYIYIYYEPLSLWKALLVPLATGLFLGVVGLAVSSIARSSLAGYGAGLLYWLFEAGMQGQFTAPFFLLIASHQPTAGDFWRSPELWLPAKLGLLILTAFLFWMAGFLPDPSPTRRRALLALALAAPAFFALGWIVIPFLYH